MSTTAPTSWASRLTHQAQSIPQAFVCRFSKKIMDDPIIGLCGHLFDKNVMSQTSYCPIDFSSLKGSIDLPDLKKRIQEFKQQQSAEMGNLSENMSKLVIQSQQLPENMMVSPYPLVQGVSGNWKKKAEDENLKPTEQKIELQCKKTIVGAHLDDIHGFLSISDNAFVSCSKDNTVNMWDKNGGKFLGKIQPQNVPMNYRLWGTSLASFKNGLWASGTRDGYIYLWDKKGKQVSEIRYNPSAKEKSTYFCKDRNKNRINCIAELPNSKGQFLFYTGTPKYLQLWDGTSGRLLAYHKASNNDWVYCVEVLENNDLIVVIGSDLEVWDMANDQPNRTSLFKELRTMQQRPHISAITRLDQQKNILAAACFDGTVKIADIDSQKQIIEYAEHKGRVWSVINFQQLIVSSADDKMIKLWDIRKKDSVCTLTGNPGRVSALLRLNDNQFISGSCPDEVFQSKEKASICFWDIRNLEEKKSE